MPTVCCRPLADRLSVATAACPDVGTLVRIVFDIVAKDVAFAFACLATTDPDHGLISTAFKSHPLPIGDEEFAAAEYGAPDVNQFADLARRAVPVGVLSVDTDGRPLRCRRLRDFMAPRFGFTDELRLVCRTQNTTWALLALYRSAGEPSFTSIDAMRIATVGEVIANSVRRTLFADHAPGAEAARGPVVLILDATDRVTDRSAAADDLIEELGGWDNGSLPASVLVVAASARSGLRPAESRVPGRCGGWLTLRAVKLDDSSTSRSVVVTIDTAGPAAVGQMTIAARGLTAREHEVVGLVLHGASTKDIAAVLHLSPHTVQDHLKAIFGKLGVNSRRELIAQFVLA